ncbi:hypothetical protein [Limnohabitans planktonicus]|nr:hypothetical protein [Limnohabitans planktonicus]
MIAAAPFKKIKGWVTADINLEKRTEAHYSEPTNDKRAERRFRNPEMGI